VSSDQTLTLFFPPRGELAESILQTLGEWASAELISESFWIPVGSADATELPAKRIAPDGIHDVVFPLAIGQTAWETVRYIVLQPVSPELSPDLEQVNFAKKWSEFFRTTVLPAVTTLIKVNLVIPSFGIEELTQDCLIPTWDLTIMASPEERESPGHANIFRNVALGEHAAMAAASVGGIWIGARNSAVEQYIGESTSGEARPRLLRTYVRTVLGGDPGSEIATRALAPSNGMWRVPENSENFAICPDPEALVGRVVSDLGLLDGGALVYPMPPADFVPVKGKGGFKAIWREFVEFFGWIVTKIKRIPGRIRENIENRITQKVWGSQGAYNFGFGVTPAREEVVQLVELRPKKMPRRGRELRTFAASVLSRLGSQAQLDPPRPALWEGMRMLAFGLVDGGPMPDSFRQLNTAPRQLILDPKHISPDISSGGFEIPSTIGTRDARLAVWAGTTIHPADPLAASLFKNDLLISELGQNSEPSEVPVGDLEVEVGVAGFGGGDAPVDSGDIEESEESTSVPRDFAEQIPQVSANAGDLSAEFEEWVGARKGSLTWRIADRVASEANAASTDLNEALSALDPDIHVDIAEIDRARRRFLWMTLVWFILGIAVGVLGVVVFKKSFAPLLAVSLFFLLTLNSFFRFTRKKSQVEFAFECLVANQRNAMARMEHSARELARISSLYDLTVDWSELIGTHVHAPWAIDTSVQSEPLAIADSIRTRPASLIIGESLPDEVKVTALSNIERRSIQGVSWLQSEFNATVNRVISRMAAREGLPIDSIDPDNDCWANPIGSRTFLLEELRSGEPQRESYQLTLSGIRERCAKRNPSEIFSEVSFGDDGEREASVQDFLTALEPSNYLEVPGFIGDLLTDPARVALRHERPIPHVVLPPGVGDHDHASEKAAHITSGGRYLVQSVRVDMGEHLTPSDYKMFAPPAWAEAEQAPINDADPGW
jgi:hypothetical protein